MAAGSNVLISPIRLKLLAYNLVGFTTRMPCLCPNCDNYVQQIPICVHALVSPFELEAGIGPCVNLLAVGSLQASFTDYIRSKHANTISFTSTYHGISKHC